MQRRMARWTALDLAVVAGSISATAGAGLVVSSLGQETAVFGMFAYAPLSATTVVTVDGVPTAVEIIGYGIAVLGLMVLAWSAGYRRSPRTRRPFFPEAPRATRVRLAVATVTTTLLLLTGAALVVTAPPSLPLLSAPGPAQEEVSVAYSSELTLDVTAQHGPLLVPGLALLLGGLLLTATAAGHRAGVPVRSPGR